jgi:hypothetical protein
MYRKFVSDSSRVTVNSTAFSEPSSSREVTPILSDSGLSISSSSSSSSDMFNVINTSDSNTTNNSSPSTSAENVLQTPEKTGNKRYHY